MEDSARDIAKLIHADDGYSLSLDMIEDYIRNFAKQKCKEQRELCANNHPAVCLGFDQGKVRNAPEPEFD